MYSFTKCCNLGTYEIGSEVPGNVWNVVLERDGKDRMDWSCNKWRRVRKSQEGEEESGRRGRVRKERNSLQTIKRSKAKWICHIFAQEVISKTRYWIEGRKKVTGRRRIRCKQPLDELHEKRGYWKLKAEALDRNLWRICFGRGCGPVVRQARGWMSPGIVMSSP